MHDLAIVGRAVRRGRVGSKPSLLVCCSAEKVGLVKEKSVSVILLAGGKGKRMGVSLQLLSLLLNFLRILDDNGVSIF